MFVCVALSLIITMCYVCIPYFTRSRVPSHISVATSVGNKSIGSMWRERFGLYFPNDETPNLVCLFLAFPHFLSCFPIFFSYFFYGAHVFFSCSSHRSFGRTSWFYWYFCEGFQKVMLLWRCWSGLVFSFNLTFCRNFRIRFQLQVPWEWLEVEKLQYNFKKEVLGYDNTMSPGVSFELFFTLTLCFLNYRAVNFCDSTLAETWQWMLDGTLTILSHLVDLVQGGQTEYYTENGLF